MVVTNSTVVDAIEIGKANILFMLELGNDLVEIDGFWVNIEHDAQFLMIVIT